MVPQHIIEAIKSLDAQVTATASTPPEYSPLTHYKEVGSSPYFHDITIMRHIFKVLCDDYMTYKVRALNIDMYMYTPSASSPMGPGSDSKPVHFDFGGHSTFLTDSAQFGFEPLMLNGIERAYSYLPSLRGEDADNRHLNQFYHTEIEVLGDREVSMNIAEGIVKALSEGFSYAPNLFKNISKDPQATMSAFERIAKTEHFPRITFDEACDLLVKNGHGEYVNDTPKGRDISSKGELILMEILGYDTPVWMTDFDRDRVAFYQKPNPTDTDKVLNADLLFPPLIQGSFGGEIIGLGQRQDTVHEIVESLERQEVSGEPYDWYIDLRSDPRYQVTSGFGLGIERYLTWSLALTNIRDAILYPRIKGEISKP